MNQSSTTVAELMRQSGVAFGTSGARGLVSAMTDRVCHGYTTGFLQFMIEDGAWDRGGRVALSGDLRSSTPRILAACAQAVRDLGGEPVFCDYVPTPALAYWAFGEGIPSVMVTGSHIPDDRNGIKFYRPDGEILKEDEAGISRQIVGLSEVEWASNGNFVPSPVLPPARDVGPRYRERYVDACGPEALKDMHVGVYQHSAVGRDILAEILSALGARITLLGRSDAFISVDTEAVRSEDIDLARQWASEHELDAIASTDGDSDRPMLADHRGEWLRGDVLGMLCAQALDAKTVVTPVSSNSLVEKCGAFDNVHRTKIGSPYVIAAMNAALQAGERAVCGYEANGGFLLGSDIPLRGKILKALPTRDAVLPIIAVLVASRKGRLRDLLSNLPPRFTFSDRLQDFISDRRDALMAWLQADEAYGRHVQLDEVFGPIAGSSLASISFLDGVRMAFANERIIHFRGSGNAPEMRCYTEAECMVLAASLNSASLGLIAERFLYDLISAAR